MDGHLSSSKYVFPERSAAQPCVPEGPLEKIDVHPFAARSPSTGYRMCNELPADAASECVLGDHRIDKERVHASIPRNIEEAYEFAAASIRAYPSEAVFLNLAFAAVIDKSRCPNASACNSFNEVLSKSPRHPKS
jgi:hypothetical protein